MSNEKCEVIFCKISKKVNQIIPTRWSKVLLYAEVVPGVVTNYYCFYEADQGELVEFASIPKKYGVQRDQVKYATLELTRLIRQLKMECANSNQKAWTTMTFTLKSDGEFNIDYGYDNLEETDVIYRREQWEKKYLNV